MSALRLCRYKAGKRVADVAAALQISRQAVYHWEQGLSLPKAKHLIKIAELYGCTVNDLLEPGKKEE